MKEKDSLSRCFKSIKRNNEQIFFKSNKKRSNYFMRNCSNVQERLFSNENMERKKRSSRLKEFLEKL